MRIITVLIITSAEEGGYVTIDHYYACPLVYLFVCPFVWQSVGSAWLEPGLLKTL